MNNIFITRYCTAVRVQRTRKWFQCTVNHACILYETETTHRYTFNKGDSVYLNDAPPCVIDSVEYYIHTKLIMFYNYTKLIIASRQCKRLSFNEELNQFQATLGRHIHKQHCAIYNCSQLHDFRRIVLKHNHLRRIQLSPRLTLAPSFALIEQARVQQCLLFGLLM